MKFKLLHDVVAKSILDKAAGLKINWSEKEQITMDFEECRNASRKTILDLRYLIPPLCCCEKRAEIKVVMSEKKKSKGMLYYSCKLNNCGFFRWCKPETYSSVPNVGEEESCGDFKGTNFSNNNMSVPETRVKPPVDGEAHSKEQKDIQDIGRWLCTRFLGGMCLDVPYDH